MMNSTNKILIVDDSEANLDYLRDLLKRNSYKVASAKNGESAIAKVKSQKFDLILLDYVMPEMDGLSACRIIKKDPYNADTPIIFLTANQTEQALIDAFDAGAVDFLTKPFSSTELIARVKNHLSLVQSKKDLAKAKEIAEHANKAKGEFLANMSHEIRTPMNGIITVIEFLKETGLTNNQYELLDIIKTSSDNLLEIINDILDFSKIEAGQVELDFFNFNLRNELNSMLKPLELKAKEKGLHLEFECDPKIPEVLYGDAFKIKQVLINLVNNAIKFTQHGRIKLLLSPVSNKLNKHEILFEVHDTGIGIAEKNLNKLFKSFSQTDASSSRKYGGTGLGLAICRKLVTMMGGRIHVKSEYQKGSNFYFNLFLTEPDDKTIQNHHKELQHPKIISSKRMLVVDDNAINRKVAKMTLEKLGHQVDLAENGRIAFDKYLNNRYDIILMDVQMPELDGMETTAMIRRKESENQIKKPVPIIAMTAAAMKGDRERFIECGMNEYISKPFKIKDIVNIIELILDH